MKIDRRNLLLGAGAAAAVGTLPVCAATLRSRVSGDAAVESLLAEIGEDLLSEYPENATALGIDKGNRAGLKSRLTDRSLGGRRRLAAAAASRLAELKAVDERVLGPGVKTDLEVVRAAHELAVEGFAFPFGDVVSLNQSWSYRNSPYVVAQNTGAFIEYPDFLDSNHVIASPADAEAYLARLE
ncbi:MAG TPA: DUF885 family protein, partial [Allosphingosinicella sp.]